MRLLTLRELLWVPLLLSLELPFWEFVSTDVLRGKEFRVAGFTALKSFLIGAT
ncbi:MAG: hypothetical protein IPM54_06475 [Polyangiaceae bacterium]|nr:hypothetical protein [Polyangiaceae bacterium]